MPAELMRRVLAARTFNQGFATVEYVASALVDLDFHLQADAGKLRRRRVRERGAGAHRHADRDRHAPPADPFRHVFAGGGYASAYYSYMWSEVLDADAFAAFEETGDIFDPATAKGLHDHVYSAGGTRDPAALYRLPRPAADA